MRFSFKTYHFYLSRYLSDDMVPSCDENGYFNVWQYLAWAHGHYQYAVVIIAVMVVVIACILGLVGAVAVHAIVVCYGLLSFCHAWLCSAEVSHVFAKFCEVLVCFAMLSLCVAMFC